MDFENLEEEQKLPISLSQNANGGFKVISRLKDYILDNQFKIVGKLAEGSFGEIYHGFNINTGKQIVIKLVAEHQLNEAEV